MAQRLHERRLIFAIGVDDRRRRAFEAALADEGVIVARGRLSAGDPWAQIVELAGRGTPCVSWAEGDVELVRPLDLGHERLHELPTGLLIWIGGLDAIESFPVQAPKLWARRTTVEWVVSALDFRPPRLMESTDSDSRLDLDDPGQATELLDGAAAEVDAGHFARADAMLSMVSRSSTLAARHRLRAHAIAAKSAVARGRVDDAHREVAKFGERSLPVTAIERLHAKRARHALALALLRPFESLRHAFECHALLVGSREPELAIDEAGPIVDSLLSLGLASDAHEVVDELLALQPRSPDRRLSLHVMRARTLIACGAMALGVEQLWLALDGYQSALDAAPPLSFARLSLAAIELIHRDLIFLAPAHNIELCELGLALARRAEQAALAERQPDGLHARGNRPYSGSGLRAGGDLAFDARSAQVRLLRALGRHAEARAQIEHNLAWSQQHHGAIRICHGHLELARLDMAREQPSRALVEIDRARHVLELEPARWQPHASWAELSLVHARVLAAVGEPERARAEASEACDRMRAAGLLGETLQILHVLAEPLTGEHNDALPEREQAAASALALATHSGLIDQQARALANFALVRAEQGHRQPAEAMIGEALWLIGDRLHGRVREHVDSTAARIDAMFEGDH